MDKACLINNILNIQCKHGHLGSALSDQLSAGTRKAVCLDRYNVATGYLLGILKDYKSFESPVTYAYKVTFNRTSSTESPLTSATVSLSLKDNNLTSYVGTGDGNDIAIHFEALINTGSLTVTYSVERISNVLYIYSYDTNASFSDIGTTTSSTTKVTATSISLENNLDEILNIWNNLTEQELCNLITFATKTASSSEDLTSGGGSGCNC
tara:strand:+ start:10559 stop:11188 length:630 start_codon:yes stop_codon:yes gene_type:complete